MVLIDTTLRNIGIKGKKAEALSEFAVECFKNGFKAGQLPENKKVTIGNTSK